MISNKKYIRYHKNLPTMEEANNQESNTYSTEVTSDHVLIYSSVPAKENSEETISILSQNAMDLDSANGFAKLGQKSYGESEEQKENRHTRIATTIAEFVTKNNTDFITLQEMFPKRNECNLLIKFEKDEYLDIEQIKKLSCSNDEKPILIRHGIKVSMYGRFQEKWQLIGLDASEFEGQEFPISEEKILSKHSSELNSKALANITLRQSHDSMDNKEILLEKILTKLPKNYAVVKIKNIENEEVLVNGGNVILYNKEKYKLDEEKMKDVKTLKKSKFSIALSSYFINNETQEKVKIVNVHASYSNAHEDVEEGIAEHLSEKDVTCIAAGDFNFTVAPAHDDPQNTVTCVSNTSFKYQGDEKTKEEDKLQQGASAIDGVFYSSSGSTEGKQANIEHIDNKTNEVIDKNDLFPLDTDQAPEQQKQVIEAFRMVLTVDPFYKTKRIGGQTVLEAQQILRKKLNDNDLLLRPAKSLNNLPGISIRVSNNKYLSITHYLNNKDKEKINAESLQVTRQENDLYFSTDLDNAEKLYNLFNDFPNIAKLVAFTATVKKVNEDDNIPENVRAKYQELSDSLYGEDVNIGEQHYADIIDHFSNEAVTLLKTSKTFFQCATPKEAKKKIKQIQYSEKKLDEKLYGKKPFLSTGVKIAIAGVFGAIIGFIGGFAIGFFATGGTLSGPMAYKGAVTGWTIGSAIGAAVFVAGAAAVPTGIVGKKANDNYNNKYMKTGTTSVKNAVTSVSLSMTEFFKVKAKTKDVVVLDNELGMKNEIY